MAVITDAHRPRQGFATALKHARQRAKFSQLELALRLEVSQRHVSFVETGRSQPSRALLAQWLEALELPLALRNELMLQAGYAPLYTEGTGDASGERVARSALGQLLAAHDPMPALVMNARWDVLQINAGGKRLMSLLMPELASGFVRQLAEFESGRAFAPNVADAMLHPRGFTSKLINPQDVCPAVLAHMRQDAVHEPALQPRVVALQAMLRAQLGAKRMDRFQSIEPVVTSRFRTELGDIALFSMFTTFGSPQSIGLASLRVEHMFPADAQTESLMRQLAA